MGNIYKMLDRCLSSCIVHLNIHVLPRYSTAGGVNVMFNFVCNFTLGDIWSEAKHQIVFNLHSHCLPHYVEAQVDGGELEGLRVLCVLALPVF